MGTRHDPSIRQKLTRIILATCGASILVSCTVLAAYELVTFRRDLANDLVETAGVTGSNTTAALVFGDAQSARETLSLLRTQPHIVEACIYTRDGSVFATYARQGAKPDRTPPRPGPEGSVTTRRDMVVFEPIRLNGEPIGTIYLKSDLEGLYARMERFTETVLIVILASFVTAYLMASRLQRAISGPILELARTAFAVSVGKDYSIRATKRSTDEVGFLFDRFNDMLGQIQEREAALQRAHDELEVRVDERTRELQKEVAERKQAERELEERTRFLNSVIETSPVGIVVIDSNGCVQMCNPAFEKVFGYCQQDLRGRHLSDLLTPPERRPEMESIIKAFWEGKPTHNMTQRKRSDGTLVDVETFSVPLGEEGKFGGAVLLYQDISERKRAERELEDRTNFLNAVIENSPLGIVATALDDTVQMCNPAFESLFGYRQQDILGRNIIDTLSTGELRTEMQSTKTRMTQGRPVHLVTRRRRRDGVLMDVEVLAAPIVRCNEQSGNLVIYQDISERKRAQQELEEQKRFLNSLIDNCPVAIVALDGNHAVKMCNPAFESLFRYRQQDILGRSIVDLLSSGELRTEMESTRDTLQPGTLIHRVTQRRRSDGSLVDVEVLVAQIATEEKSLGSLAMYQDITERKRAERELEERTSFLNSLIENTPVGIAAIDSDGAVKMCNPAFESLFGYRQQDILGRRLKDLLTTPENRAEVDSNSERLQQGKTTHLVARRKRSDGSLVDVEAHSVPLGAAGRYTGAVLLYQDITERKRAEEALLHAKEAAEAASRAKSEFLANMSHEIRTPMNGIIGMTELALDTGLTAEQREYLGMVKTSADSLLTLINDILDFSKIEAGKLDVEMIDFPFKQSLGETIKALAFRAHQKGLELAWHVQPGVPERLKGDGSRLRQVLVNLVGNAVKFTEQGEVVVDVKKEAEDESGILLHFRVRDTGIGIPKEKQKMIFEAFTQADGSTTREYGGTGLGLSITLRIVELMGGAMWLESEMGRGSTFHFTCRFGFAETHGQPVVPPDPEMTQDLPVLVVDDNETNRFILLEMLSAWRMRPQGVTGGKAALAALERGHQEGQPFRLVITDMLMPEMDGVALSEKIRRSSGFADIPILLLSSSGQQREAARCRQLNVASYLTKPVQPSELLDAILAALSQPLEIQNLPPANQDVPRGGTAGMKVLLAEDNAVNRKLVTALLEKHGHSVVVAENGRIALEAVERESVDLVLMDVQMPVMDGFEAIRAIRNKEKPAGAHLPIIALTAHAMQGDRERCLAAGADDYVTKPIRTPELLAAMDRLRAQRPGPGPAELPAAKAPASRVLDVAAALERVEGDRDLLEELVQIFAGECPKNMAKIRHALEAHDARLLERLAHTIKGSSANLGANRVSRAAFELEKQARSGALENTGEWVEKLQREIGQLLLEIESFCRKVAP